MTSVPTAGLTHAQTNSHLGAWEVTSTTPALIPLSEQVSFCLPDSSMEPADFETAKGTDQQCSFKRSTRGRHHSSLG